jgi:hypothetical protein
VSGPVTVPRDRVGDVPEQPTRRRLRLPSSSALLPLVGRRREVLLLGLGSLGLAAAMTWPVLRSPRTHVAQELVDPLYFVWQIAWTGHALTTDPASMYTTNAFLGADGNLAYTDTILGYAPFAAVVNAVVPGTGGAILTYNLLYVLAVALAFAGAYLLTRVLGAGVPGALVAAAGFAFAPWHLAHARHLNVLSTGGIALTFALLAYGHGWSLRADRAGRPGQVRPRWIFLGWLVACWQLSLGFAIGIPFAWALALIIGAALISWQRRGRPTPAPGLRAAEAGGMFAFLVTGALLALPYLQVIHNFPIAARRTEEMVHRFSPPVRGLITAPPESWWWGSLHEGLRQDMNAVPEQAVLPGLVLFLLAVAGLGYSAWARRYRVTLAVAVLVLAVLAVGTSAPGGGNWTYLVIFRHLPGWEAMRTPGRLVLWATLALALLAAGAVTKASEQLAASRRTAARADRADGRSLRPRLVRAWPVLVLIPAILVLSEGIGVVKQPRVPVAPVALWTLPGPVLVLPTGQQLDYKPMTWSTDRWPLLINGGSGFESPVQAELRRTAFAFPQLRSVRELRARGVQTVVLDRALTLNTPWSNLAALPEGPSWARAADAGVRVRYQGTAVIYDIRP